MYWSHYCFTYKNSAEKWTIYQDGEFGDEGELPKYDGPLDPNGAYVIGKLNNSAKYINSFTLVRKKLNFVFI